MKNEMENEMETRTIQGMNPIQQILYDPRYLRPWKLCCDYSKAMQ